MRRSSTNFPNLLSIVVASSTLLCACGGGGSDSSDAVPANTARLDCQVADGATGDAVAGATVSYQAGTTEFTTQTSANGRCRLDMPAAEVAGVQYPAASVTKEGYEPQTILCQSLQGGSACSQNVQLTPLATNISIPDGGDSVMHLGDGMFEGAANSQFQKATDGVELVFRIADWAEQVKVTGITKATVFLDAKGWQSDICANQIALSGDAGSATLPGGVSPPAGYWGGGRQVPFEFPVAQVGTLSAELRITAGACGDAADVDDFEINRIRVEFN